MSAATSTTAERAERLAEHAAHQEHERRQRAERAEHDGPRDWRAERRAAWLGHLRRQRAERVEHALRAERRTADADHADALDADALADAAESTTAAQRRARADVTAARRRDAWLAAQRGRRMDAHELLARCAAAAESVTGATDDERADVLGALLLGVGQRYGFEPPLVDADGRPAVADAWLARRAAGLIADARKRAERTRSLDAEREHHESETDALVAERPDAWQDALGRAPLAALRRDGLAAATSADRLAVRLGVARGALLGVAERTLLAAALARPAMADANGRKSSRAKRDRTAERERGGRADALASAEIAAALGVSAATLRKRIHDGRRIVAGYWPDADALADAVADAQRLGAPDADTLALGAAERHAAGLVDAAAHRTAKRAAVESRRGRTPSRGVEHGGGGARPVPTLALGPSPLALRWLARIGPDALGAAALYRIRPVPVADARRSARAAALRRRVGAYMAERMAATLAERMAADAS